MTLPLAYAPGDKMGQKTVLKLSASSLRGFMRTASRYYDHEDPE